jgi:hypothetical protein
MNKLKLVVVGTALFSSLVFNSRNIERFSSNLILPILESNFDSSLSLSKIIQKENEEKNINNAKIEINIPSTTLRYFENDSLIMQTDICVGSPKSYIKRVGRYESFKTPIKNSIITSVEKDPWWRPDPKRIWSFGQKPVPPGPMNPLGPYKMRFGYSSIFIHGTNSPYQLGQAKSHGCIRIHSDSISILAPMINDKINKGIKVKCDIKYNISEIYCLSKEEKYYAVRIFSDIYRNRPDKVNEVIKNFEKIGIKLNDKDKNEIKKNCVFEGIMFFYYTEEGLKFKNAITDWRVLPKIYFTKESFVYN